MNITIINNKIGTIKLDEIRLDELEKTLEILKSNNLIQQDEVLVEKKQETKELDFTDAFLNTDYCKKESLPRTYDENGNEKEYVEKYSRIICPNCKQGGAISTLHNHFIYDYVEDILYRIKNEDSIEIKGDDNKINKEHYLELLNDLYNIDNKVEDTIIADDTIYECPCCNNTFTSNNMVEELKKYDYNFCPVCNIGEIDPVLTNNFTTVPVQCSSNNCLNHGGIC